MREVMKTGRLTLSLLFGLCLLLSGAPVSAAGLPVTWEARLEPGDARAGEGAQVVVAATRIEAPWHIYSLTPREGPGPRPTSVELLPGPALAAAGKPVQPEPKREFDEGFKINVEVYENNATFTLPVKLAEGAVGAQRAVVKVRYQACKGGSCMPPKTLELPLSFTVADGPARSDRLQAVTSR
jgi:thiol:disulfide interchange protein DsbD